MSLKSTLTEVSTGLVFANSAGQRTGNELETIPMEGYELQSRDQRGSESLKDVDVVACGAATVA